MTDKHSTCFLPDESATLAAGAALARACGNVGLLTLSGDLGCGKTTLCRGLIHALGHTGAVKSPTYTLVESYDLPNCRVLHCDLYRLADPDELEYLGLREALDGRTLCLIEWPERAGRLLPVPDIALRLTLDGAGRRLSWQAQGQPGERIAQALAKTRQKARKNLDL